MLRLQHRLQRLKISGIFGVFRASAMLVRPTQGVAPPLRNRDPGLIQVVAESNSLFYSIVFPAEAQGDEIAQRPILLPPLVALFSGNSLNYSG